MASSAPDGPRVYVAGPLGFFDAGRQYLANVLLPRLIAEGFTPLDPWTTPEPLAEDFANAMALGPGADKTAALERINRALGARNVALIESAETVLAILDGPDVDSGTAAEIGFAAAHRVPVVGLYTDLRSAGDNPAAPVNLQVLHFVLSSGGSLERTLPSALARLHELATA